MSQPPIPIPLAPQPGQVGLALVGNPGSGKSTILNGIARGPAFRSGISLGTGMTTRLQHFDASIAMLYDTPGLSDPTRAKEAGLELDALLQLNADVRICFVVTLENGRVRPADTTTIDVVLSAITSVDVNDLFGVIINQLLDAVMRKINEDEESALLVRSMLTGRFSTRHWFYVQKEPTLEGQEDKMLMFDDLLTFLMQLPETKPKNAIVEKIDTSTMKEKQEEYARKIQEMERFNEQRLKQLREEFEKDKERYNVHINELKKSYIIVKTDNEELHRRQDENEVAYREKEEQWRVDLDGIRKSQQDAETEVESLRNELKKAQVRNDELLSPLNSQNKSLIERVVLPEVGGFADMMHTFTPLPTVSIDCTEAAISRLHALKTRINELQSRREQYHKEMAVSAAGGVVLGIFTLGIGFVGSSAANLHQNNRIRSIRKVMIQLLQQISSLRKMFEKADGWESAENVVQISRHVFQMGVPRETLHGGL